MKDKKDRRSRKIRMPPLGKLSLNAEDFDVAPPNSPTSDNQLAANGPLVKVEGASYLQSRAPRNTLPTTPYLAIKISDIGLDYPEPLRSKASSCGKTRKKTSKSHKSVKADRASAGPKVGSKVMRGCKRKHNELQCSESTSEYSFTNRTKPSDVSDSQSGSTSYISDSDDYSSCRFDDRSEYYYTDYSERSYVDYGSSSSDDSYSDSYSEARTRKGFVRDVPNQQPGAGIWHPVYDPKVLGKGSFATVYLSYSKASKRYFAVKRPNGCRPSTLKSLTREADILKKLHSPYIIGYLGECRVPVTLKSRRSGSRPKPVAMVTEIYLPYMKRGTLADMMRLCRKKKRVMKESLIRNYTKQILSGLSYLHSIGIVHCDIKGSNILVGKSHLKISDFGVSKQVVPSQNRRSISRAGTRAWMAPEVRMRVEQGFPADVWSLGCTVVQMITGKPPMSKGLLSFLDSATLCSEPPLAVIIPKDFKSLSSECIDFLRKCFLKDTKARWTCQQLLDHPFLKAK